MDALRRWFSSSRSGTGANRVRPSRRSWTLEPLEGRIALAATDMAAVTGRVFRDVTGNGYTAGEEVAGATVNLYRDDGDNIFEPGAGDTLVGPDTTDAGGIYRFDTVIAGTYFVQQPAQVVGAITLTQRVSNPIVISAAAVMGIVGLNVDSFNTTTQAAEASPGTPTATSSLAAPEAIGGERDMFVTLTAGTGNRIYANTAAMPLLLFDAGPNATGTRQVTWDGADGDATTLAPTGLGGADLTSAGASTAFQLLIGADLASGTGTLRVFTNGTDFSDATFNIPATAGGAPTQTVVVPFASFTTAGGAGTSFANVGAIRLDVVGNVAVDVQIDMIEALGPTLFSQNFDNLDRVDLSLTKVANNPSPSVGQNVIFTVAVANAGPASATNVVVNDILPAGMTFVSSAPTQGTYNGTTGVWTVGTIAAGGNASLQITATVVTAGQKINTAQVCAADQLDLDSTPCDGNAQQDDQASATVNPITVDLAVTKTVNVAAPNVGQNVIFTVTVNNTGSGNATNVTVFDQLPAGVTFVSSTPSQGTYNSTTGNWVVGTINAGGSATLSLTATRNVNAARTNTAQVCAMDQLDLDSTPCNGNAAEDDQASVTLALPRVLTKRRFLAR